MLTINDYRKSLNTTAAADHNESERRLDDLLALIRSHPDPVGIAKWFIESISIEMMVYTITGDLDDPIKNLQIMSQALWDAFAFAWAWQEDPAHRRDPVLIVQELFEEIDELIRDWDTEYDRSAGRMRKPGLPPGKISW